MIAMTSGGRFLDASNSLICPLSVIPVPPFSVRVGRSVIPSRPSSPQSKTASSPRTLQPPGEQFPDEGRQTRPVVQVGDLLDRFGLGRIRVDDAAEGPQADPPHHRKRYLVDH